MSEIKIPSEQNLIDYGKSLWNVFTNALSERFTRYDNAADKVAAAQNAEKSATDLALMQDVKREPFSATGDFFLNTLEDGIVAILGIKNEIDFNKVANGDTLLIKESSGEFKLYLSVLSSALVLGASYRVSGQVMGILMTQESAKIVAGRFDAVRPLSSTEFTSVSVTLFPSADNESGSLPKHHEVVFMQTGDDGEFVCETEGYPVFENIKVGDIVSIDAQDPGNNVLMRIFGTVTNTEGGVELRNVLMCSDKGTTSIPYFNITQGSPTKCYFYPTDFPTFTPTQRVWNFEYAGTDMYVIPDGWAENAKVGDCVNVWDSYFGFIAQLSSDNAGGAMILLNDDSEICRWRFKSGRISSKENVSVPALDIRLKALESSSVTLTRAEYDALATKNSNTTYYITDDGGLLQ